MSLHNFSLTGMKVLVVEDDYLVGADLAETLQSFGAQVIGPISACGDALSVLATGEISTAVLDINVEGEAVFPLADELVSRHVPFVLATGYDPATIPDDYAEMPVIEKPYHTEALAAALLRAAEDQRGRTRQMEGRDRSSQTNCGGSSLVPSGVAPIAEGAVVANVIRRRGGSAGSARRRRGRRPQLFAANDAARFEV